MWPSVLAARLQRSPATARIALVTEQGEAIRQAANQWIRTRGAFDAVFDFDRGTRDPNDPTRFRADADSPDMLHPPIQATR